MALSRPFTAKGPGDISMWAPKRANTTLNDIQCYTYEVTYPRPF